MQLKIPAEKVNNLPHLKWSIQTNSYKDTNANKSQDKAPMLKQQKYGWRPEQSCCIETTETLLQHTTAIKQCLIHNFVS